MFGFFYEILPFEVVGVWTILSFTLLVDCFYYSIDGHAVGVYNRSIWFFYSGSIFVRFLSKLLFWIADRNQMFTINTNRFLSGIRKRFLPTISIKIVVIDLHVIDTCFCDRFFVRIFRGADRNQMVILISINSYPASKNRSTPDHFRMADRNMDLSIII